MNVYQIWLKEFASPTGKPHWINLETDMDFDEIKDAIEHDEMIEGDQLVSEKDSAFVRRITGRLPEAISGSLVARVTPATVKFIE